MRGWALGATLLLTLAAHAADGGPRAYLQRPAAWFAGDEAATVTAHLLGWQSDLGGWPKNVDTTTEYRGTDRAADLKPTFDNGATTDELRFLARRYTAVPEERVKAAVLRGYDHILVAQYPTGGWPQFYPPSKQYHRHITFNDNAMVRLLEFLRESWTAPHFALLDGERRAKAHSAFDRGIACILRCQVKVDGRLTAWCAQHDELDLTPRPGRKYELVSLSGAESVGLVRLLMSLPEPSAEVRAAVDAAVAWFQAAALHGVREVVVDDPLGPRGKDKRVVADANAPLLWARFYEIGTNAPIYCDRDGLAKHALAEIGYERRNGYRWLGDWPRELLATEYPAWRDRL